ncbi:hypothetical protein U1Q18_043300 [Sarracenia purpurea var. burkii]
MPRLLDEGKISRTHGDLSHRIRYRAFICEMGRIAKEEWRKTGDRPRRPYGEDSSSSPTTPDQEFLSGCNPGGSVRCFPPLPFVYEKASGSEATSGVGILVHVPHLSVDKPVTH